MFSYYYSFRYLPPLPKIDTILNRNTQQAKTTSLHLRHNDLPRTRIPTPTPAPPHRNSSDNEPRTRQHHILPDRKLLLIARRINKHEPPGQDPAHPAQGVSLRPPLLDQRRGIRQAQGEMGAPLAMRVGELALQQPRPLRLPGRRRQQLVRQPQRLVVAALGRRGGSLDEARVRGRDRGQERDLPL